MGLAGVTLGGSVVASRVGLREMPVFTLIALRLTLAAGAFAIILAILRPPLPVGARMWMDITLVGLLNTALPLTAFTLALQYMSSGVIALFLALIPLSTGLMAHVGLAQEKLTLQKLGGLVLAFSGVLVLLLTGTSGLPTVLDPRGPVLSLSAVVLSSFATVYARRQLGQANVITLTAVQTFVAALVLVPLGLYLARTDLTAVGTTGWLAVAYTGLVGSVIAFLAFFQLIREFGATSAAETTYLTPPVSGLLGVLLLDELISRALVFGAALILLGVFLAERVPHPGAAKSGPSGAAPR